MAGTKQGGLKAAATNREKYGKDFYAKIGQKGGRLGCTGGFAANPALAKIAGAKGGRISRRGPAKKTTEQNIHLEITNPSKEGFLFFKLFGLWNEDEARVYLGGDIFKR